MQRIPAAALLLSLLLAAACARAGEAGSLDFGLTLEGHPGSVRELDVLEQDIGVPIRMLNVFVQWPGETSGGWFPWPFLDAAAASGILPCITWEPMAVAHGKEHMVSGRDILAGIWDPYLAFFAGEARRFGKPLVVRLAHEMNLARYHWFVAPEDYGPASPTLYREVFRYVAAKLRAGGAGNVLLAFCPNVESVPGPGNAPDAVWNSAAAWWPGHDVVDLLGMDGYNWGTFYRKQSHGWDSSWKDFAAIFAPLRQELRGLAPDKPLLVFETASTDNGGDKDAWAADAARTAAQWGIRSMLWFDVRKEQDWRFPRHGKAAEVLRGLAGTGTSAAAAGYR